MSAGSSSPGLGNKMSGLCYLSHKAGSFFSISLCRTSESMCLVFNFFSCFFISDGFATVKLRFPANVPVWEHDIFRFPIRFFVESLNGALATSVLPAAYWSVHCMGEALSYATAPETSQDLKDRWTKTAHDQFVELCRQHYACLGFHAFYHFSFLPLLCSLILSFSLSWSHFKARRWLCTREEWLCMGNCLIPYCYYYLRVQNFATLRIRRFCGY